MGKRIGQYRRRRTARVGNRDKFGDILIRNGQHGRSQKGCFGGTEGFSESGMVYIKKEK